MNATLNKNNSDLNIQLHVKDVVIKALKETHKVDEEITIVADTSKSTEISPNRCNACVNKPEHQPIDAQGFYLNLK